jgi:hypothetical protein
MPARQAKTRSSAGKRCGLGWPWLLAGALLALGCGEGEAESADAEPGAYGDWGDPLEYLPRGDAHTRAVCARPGDDAVRDVFCADAPAGITRLTDLQRALGIDSAKIGGLTGLSVTGHSTALAARAVSTINPRVVALRLESAPAELLALAFARGEQLSEIVVRDRIDRELRFYVVGYRQACNDSVLGCTPGDLLTPAIEEDWLEVTLYDEQDFTNTVLDCATCHQPAGPGTPKLLRMQELDPPWTHWFFKGTDGGQALLADYFEAKGDEPLAGMTARQIEGAHPGGLSMLAIFAGSEQPNVFPSQAIEDEVRASAAERGGAQPHDNTIPGTSATWRAAYDRAQRGEAIAVPYHDVKVTDPAKLARLSAAYQAYRRGELSREELPDLRDAFPDDPARLAAMGFMTEPGLSGEAVLLQACSQCHNAQLDPTLTRARFRADLVGMSRAEKDLAIARLQLPAHDLRAMPPPRLRVLSAEARQRAIDVLRR